MTPEVLDENLNKKIKRSNFFKGIEFLLFLIYGFLTLDVCYSISYNINFVGLLLLLLIFSNLKFVYSSRKALLTYEETQNSSDIIKVKKSLSRLAFICTAVCLCFISIAVISSFVTFLINIHSSSIAPTVGNFWGIRTYLFLTLIAILPIFQIYYMVQTSHIFSFVSKD